MGFALLALTGAGCSWMSQPSARQAAKERVEIEAVDKLQASLTQFNDFFQTTVRQAADEIEQSASTRNQRKAALLWKTTMADECRSTAFAASPAAGLVDTWTLCVRMLNYFETGDGKNMFGPGQSTAVEAARKCEERIAQIASSVVPAAKLPAMRADIDQYARQAPITGVFSKQTAAPISTDAAGAKVLDFLVGIPLAPIRAVGSIQQSGQSLSDIKNTAERFTDVVEDLPASARWQLQLLGISLEESPRFGEIMKDLRTFTSSTERLVTVADEMPAKIRREGEGLFDSIDAHQPAIRATLAEARETTAALNEALRKADEISSRIERTIADGKAAAGAWESTARAVSITVNDIAAIPSKWNEGDEKRPVASEPSRPFDINDYTRSADAIERAAIRTREVLAEVQRVSLSKPLMEQFSTVDGNLRAAIDHLAWRATQLVMLIFGLIVAYRWKIAGWIGPRST
jgi:hypothetical protein